MDTLFTTDLVTNGKMETFAVSFHDGHYHFKALDSDTHFTIRREEDEWHTDDKLDKELQNIATEKLEAYLLSQH